MRPEIAPRFWVFPEWPPHSEDVEVVAALGLGVVAEHLVEDAAHAHAGRLPARDGAAAHRHQAAPRRLLPVELRCRYIHAHSVRLTRGILYGKGAKLLDMVGRQFVCVFKLTCHHNIHRVPY